MTDLDDRPTATETDPETDTVTCPVTGRTFPFTRQGPVTPPPEYAALREADVSPVTLTGSGLRTWVVTGYHTIRQVLGDPRVSASRRHEGFPFYFIAPPEFRTETSFIGYDAPEHTKTRRKAATTFTNRQVQKLRPRIEEIVEEYIGKLLAMTPPVDFHTAFSLPVPMTVICELLGIPHDDHDFFVRHGTLLLGGDATPEQRQAAIVEVNEYVANLITIKEAEPGDDLLSKVLASYEADDEPYTHRDIFNMVRLLMNGGHETTASMLSLGTATLLEHPDQLRKMVDDPETMVGPAVEELVRIATIGDTAIPRVATEDIEVAGVTIPKGEGILCLGLAGNRDPEVFPDPDTVDIERGSRKHLGFGYGVHHCIGADLARLEMQIVWSRLFQAIPTLRLATPYDEVPRKEGAVIYGFRELQVTWDA